MIALSDGKKHAGMSASAVLDEVSVARVGDAFVPVAGTFSKTEQYKDDVRQLAIYRYKRSDIAMNPRWQGTGAFENDLPERALLGNMNDQTSGIKYEWRGGKCVPVTTTFRVPPPTGSWGNRSLVVQGLWAVLGVGLFGAGLAMALRTKRWSQVAPRSAERPLPV